MEFRRGTFFQKPYILMIKVMVKVHFYRGVRGQYGILGEI